MLPSQMISPFDHFKQIVKQLYPTVTDLRCDAWSDNVQPIMYDDCGSKRTEYPPVTSWRIGNNRFKYVLAPKFKTVYNNDVIITRNFCKFHNQFSPNIGKTFKEYGIIKKERR